MVMVPCHLSNRSSTNESKGHDYLDIYMSYGLARLHTKNYICLDNFFVEHTMRALHFTSIHGFLRKSPCPNESRDVVESDLKPERGGREGIADSGRPRKGLRLKS